MKTQDGRLIVIAGASRSGKTAWVKKAVAKARRVLAWDPEDQWSQLPGWTRITSPLVLLEVINRKGAGKFAYVAGGDLVKAFDFWAGCAMYSGRYVEPCAVIAEELADVTTPAKAPGNWGVLLRRGLKRGVTIYAISQRWAEADKTAMGNASEYIIFRQATGPDAAYMSRYTRVPVAEIDSLLPLDFVRYDALTQKFERGRLRF